MAATKAWQLGEWSMTRIAGLPIDTVHELRCPQSARWADDVVETEARLQAGAEVIGDRLHDVIKDNDDQEARRLILELRRQLFNNKLPARPVDALACIRGVDGDLADQVQGWIQRRASFDQRLAAGPDLVNAELRATRLTLRRIARGDRFRAGMSLASATLTGQLRAFGASSGRSPAKKERKVERSVLAYLYRTACKTSPFSTFTGIRLGRFEHRGAAPGEVIALDGEWASHVRISVVALSRISTRILARPDCRDDVPVSVASGWEREEDRIRYVRRWVTSGDDAAAVTFDSISDHLFFLRTSEILDRILAHVEQHPGIRFAQVADWLGEQVGADPDDCSRYLAALIQVGIIHVPSLSIDTHTADPLESYIAMLRSIGRDWADQLAGLLAVTAAALADYPGADADRRVSLLRDVRSGLLAALEQLGVSNPTIPHTVLYEDVVEQSEPVQWDRGRWEQKISGPLQSLQRLLPVFDLTLPQRLTFKGFFVARFGIGGSCDDVLKLLHDFHEDFFDQYLSVSAKRIAFNADGEYVPEENWLGLPELKALDDARRSFSAGMRALAAADPEAEEIVIDETLVAAAVDGLDELGSEGDSLAHFFQLAGRGDDARLVLNQSYGGISFPFSRFAHCFDRVDDAAGLAEVLRRSSRRRLGNGKIFAEVTGGVVMSNLNFHGRLTDHEIVCPGEISSVPADRQIELGDLVARHDVATDRMVLQSRRLGVEVVPVYLGYLVPLALPEVPRALLLFSPTSMAPVDPWGGVPEPIPKDGVRYRPRVSHRGIVLRRRAWRVSARDLPLAGPVPDDAQRFLAWCRWRRRHGLPERVFARVAEPSAGGGRQLGGPKPQYVDFESMLSLIALEALVKSPDAIIAFTEMLPSAEQLVARSGAGEHVTEFAVETFTRSEAHSPKPQETS